MLKAEVQAPERAALAALLQAADLWLAGGSAAQLALESAAMCAALEEQMSKKERTQQAIEQAAYALFMEQGFNATSMRQIAERAGLALGGIYNHYPSKEAIFHAIILERHPYKQILPLILSAQGETPEEFIRAAAEAVVKTLGHRTEFMKLMFIEIVEFDGRHVSALAREIVPQLLPAFERMVRHRKSLRSIHPAVLLRSFLGLFFSYYVTDMFIKGSALARLMPRNSFDSFVDIYLHGVLKETA
jgi:AcrR family transcriptional regulator